MKEARRHAKERDKHAFQPKFDPESPAGHVRGCRCRNVGCLKKYCECFNAGVRCGVNCGCQDCKNTDGHPELLRTLSMDIPTAKRIKFNEDLMAMNTTHHLLHPLAAASSSASTASSYVSSTSMPIGIPLTGPNAAQNNHVSVAQANQAALHASANFTRTSAFDKSLDRSSLPSWLKSILITGPDRELIKVASSPVPSNVLGFTSSKRRSPASIVIDDYLTTVEYKSIACEMVSGAYKAKAEVSSLSPSSEKEDDESKVSKIDDLSDARSIADAFVAIADATAAQRDGTKTKEISLVSTASPSSPTSSNVHSFAYLTNPSLAEEALRASESAPTKLSLKIEESQEAVVLKILEERLRLLNERLTQAKIEREQEREAARQAAIEKLLAKERGEEEEEEEESSNTSRDVLESPRISAEGVNGNEKKRRRVDDEENEISSPPNGSNHDIDNSNVSPSPPSSPSGAGEAGSTQPLDDSQPRNFTESSVTMNVDA